jgi:hypothetical protein
MIDVDTEGSLRIRPMPEEEKKDIKTETISILNRYVGHLKCPKVEVCGLKSRSSGGFECASIHLGQNIPEKLCAGFNSPDLVNGIFSVQSSRTAFPTTIQESFQSVLYVQLEILPSGKGGDGVIVPRRASTSLYPVLK